MRRRAGSFGRPASAILLLGLSVGALLEASLFAVRLAPCSTTALVPIPTGTWLPSAFPLCAKPVTSSRVAPVTHAAPRQGRAPRAAARSWHIRSNTVLGVTPFADFVPAALPADDVHHRNVSLTLRAGGAQAPALCHYPVSICFTREHHSGTPACQSDGVPALAGPLSYLTGVPFVLVGAVHRPNVNPCTALVHGDSPQVFGSSSLLAEVRDRTPVVIAVHAIISVLPGPLRPCELLGVSKALVEAPTMSEYVFFTLGLIAGEVVHVHAGRGVHEVPILVLVPSGPHRGPVGGLVLEDDTAAGLADLAMRPCLCPCHGPAVYPLVRTDVKSSLISYPASSIPGPSGPIFALPRVQTSRDSRQRLAPAAVRLRAGLRQFVASSEAGAAAPRAIHKWRAGISGPDAVSHGSVLQRARIFPCALALLSPPNCWDSG